MPHADNDPAIRTGSNLDVFPKLMEQLQLSVRKHRQPIADSYRRLLRKKTAATNKAALQKAASAIDAEKRAYDAAVLSAHGNTDRIDRLKARTRRRIQRLLAGSVPRARQIVGLNKAHAKEHNRLFNRLGEVFDRSIRTDLVIGLPEVDYETFQAPFPLHGIFSDLSQAIEPPLPPEIDQYVTYNGSFVIPSWGVMANDFEYRHSHSAWLHPSAFMQRNNFAALGIRYRMPKTGHLNVSAAVQNLSNQVMMSITDNFGFSKAEIDATQRLWIIVVRPSGPLFDLHYVVTMQPKLTSGGDDVSRSFSELQTSVPYSVTLASPEPFNQGDDLSILIATDVHVSSYLEFMKCRIDATFVWLLKAIYVSVT